MSVNDYVELVKRKNRKIFLSKKIQISTRSFEEQIRIAFETGFQSGQESKSLFERIFGN